MVPPVLIMLKSMVSRIRSDIRPLCDTDRSQMGAQEMQLEFRLPGWGGTEPIFSCLQCGRHYDNVRGYYNVVEGQIRNDQTTGMRCFWGALSPASTILFGVVRSPSAVTRRKAD